MRAITITYKEGGCGWDVHEDGKCCNGLSWDEMLGQVAMLTIPTTRVGKGFQMMTPEEWEARNEAMFGKQIKQAEPQLQLEGPDKCPF